jgi:hypothetical protein
MRRFLVLGAALAAAAIVTGPAFAADPIETPFPSPSIQQLFVAAQTVTPDGAVSNFFAPGSTVTFRAYAAEPKTLKVLVQKDIKYFYVKIPNQPNVKLHYDAKAGRMPWTGTWTVPSSYPLGVVEFKVLVKSEAKRIGQFVQLPVSTSQLTISASPQAPPGTGPSPAAAAPAKLDASLYVDSVNGTRPAAAKPRPVGCTQTNVFKRGEQFVLRAWGSDLSTGDVLSSDNVASAFFTVPNQPNIALNWGAHGAASNRVWFWSNFWNVPADFPLGELTVKVTFSLESGKTGTFDYNITITP